ncbi:MAG TPA: bifunctional enoyl-CoA hydratase/phosphate acetyltransferase [Candidatus Competibacteraceae bacterium]|nr:bifunctional enoyl-CoA hydratase/phosphate acetyltransferase [Candidatus Competibacteraceae bacterium]
MEIRNLTFDEITIGASASVSRILSPADVELLAVFAGDVRRFASGHPGNGIGGRAQTQALGGEVLIAALIGSRLPGPGSVILTQRLAYQGEVAVGSRLTATVSVREKHPDRQVVLLDCLCLDEQGNPLVSGEVTVQAPREKLDSVEVTLPEFSLRRHDAFGRLLQACSGLPPVSCAVVHPCDRDSLLGAVEAARRGLITPVLVGPEAKIRAAAAAEGVDLTPYRLEPVEHSHAAAERAVALARAGVVEALMKGSLHTDELMEAVMPASTGLRTARRISHVFVMDVPTYPRLLLITDAAINITPDLEDKRDIVQNAIDLAHVLGIKQPRVAILAAVETVNPKMPATLDAAALCKMADRGQISGGLLDGPLAFDNAISLEAAQAKHIVSPVAGQADILLVPDLEAGNMLAKQLAYLAGADSAGIVLGARVPIVLTSRADSVRSRLASTALLSLLAHARRSARPGGTP